MKFPPNVHLEVTGRCNRSCIFCYNYRRRVSYEDPPLLSLRKRMEALSEKGVTCLTITGGEPTLRSDIENILEISSELFEMVVLNTNAESVLPALIDLLHALDTKVLASLHGDRETHERLTSGSYDRVITNIEKMVKRGIDLEIDFVLTRQNYDKIEKMALDLERVGVRKLGIGRLSPSSPEIENLQVTRAEFQKAYKSLSTLCSEGFEVKFLTAVPLCAVDVVTNIDPSGCTWGFLTACITPHGDVVGCPFDDEPFGNMDSESFGEIWRRIRKKRMHFDVTDCKGCSLYLKCSKGCRVAAKIAKGSYDCSDPLSKEDKRNISVAGLDQRDFTPTGERLSCSELRVIRLGEFSLFYRKGSVIIMEQKIGSVLEKLIDCEYTLDELIQEVSGEWNVDTYIAAPYVKRIVETASKKNFFSYQGQKKEIKNKEHRYRII